MTKNMRFAPVYRAAASRHWRVAGALSVSVLLFAQGPGSWAPACDETRAGGYTFEKLGGSAARPVKIYLCREVSCADKTDFATVPADSYSAPAPPGLARPYFMVERSVNAKREDRVIGARRLALEGAYNFRDLGGMRTADGKTVRWGQVFRSDTLTHLTSHDYGRLNAIGISLVCDLRSREERKTDPTDWKDGSPVFVLAPVSEDSNGASLDRAQMARLQSAKLTLEEGQSIFEGFYIRMVFDSAAKFGSVLRAVETTDRPAMFHCTGGRDRTGITAALLLHILGVPNDTIEEDFVLSTKYLDENPAALSIPGVQAGTEQARFFAEVIRLQPRYIEAVFKAIEQRYGSFDRYRREALHFSDADVVALRSRLLE
jgi:protein-tyrosine phosphatase